MTCRIGITTDIETRKAYWAGKCSNFRAWQIMAGPFNTKAEAQAAENHLAQKNRCESAPGGADPDDPNAKWLVYGFYHDGCSD